MLLQLLWYMAGFSLVFNSDYGGVIGGLRYCFYWKLGTECLTQAPTVPGLAWATFQVCALSVREYCCVSTAASHRGWMDSSQCLRSSRRY